MTTSGGKVMMKTGTDIQSAALVPARGENVMENEDEIEEITLKTDGPTDEDTTTGGEERKERATAKVPGTTRGTGMIKRTTTVFTTRAVGSVQDDHVVLHHPGVVPALPTALKAQSTRLNQISTHLGCLQLRLIPSKQLMGRAPY